MACGRDVMDVNQSHCPNCGTVADHKDVSWAGGFGRMSEPKIVMGLNRKSKGGGEIGRAHV